MARATKRRTPEKLQLFRLCFTGLEHVYGTYNPASGQVVQIKQPVTDEVILQHLKGEAPYGVYLLVQDQTRAVVADFDEDDTEAPVAFVQPPRSDTVNGLLHPGLDQLPDPCTSAELAAVLGKSPKTIVDWCQERRYTRIPCFRLGNRWYHRVPELVRWLNGIKSGQIEFRRRPRGSAERS
jgi:hypothetical protein